MKYTIKIEPYELELLVFTTHNSLKRYCKFANYALQENETSEPFSLDNVQGLSIIYMRDHAILLLLPKEYNEKIIDHELVHVTWFVAKIIGQPLDYYNNEFQAYLFTDLKDKIKKKIWKRS